MMQAVLMMLVRKTLNSAAFKPYYMAGAKPTKKVKSSIF